MVVAVDMTADDRSCHCHIQEARLTWEVTSKGPNDIFLAVASELIFVFGVWWRNMLKGPFHRCLNIIESI